MSRRMIARLVALAAVLVFAPQGRAESYPERPVRLIVPYPSGGAADVLARRLAEEMGRGLGQRVVVENIGGAGGIIGMQQVARAEPNGYTIVLALTARFAVNSSLFSKLPYDPANDHALVALLAVAPYVLVEHPGLPVRTVDDLVRLARAKPGELSYASAGNGSGAHPMRMCCRRGHRVDSLHGWDLQRSEERLP